MQIKTYSPFLQLFDFQTFAQGHEIWCEKIVFWNKNSLHLLEKQYHGHHKNPRKNNFLDRFPQGLSRAAEDA